MGLTELMESIAAKMEEEMTRQLNKTDEMAEELVKIMAEKGYLSGDPCSAGQSLVAMANVMCAIVHVSGVGKSHLEMLLGACLASANKHEPESMDRLLKSVAMSLCPAHGEPT